MLHDFEPVLERVDILSPKDSDIKIWDLANELIFIISAVSYGFSEEKATVYRQESSLSLLTFCIKSFIII